jgi:hypothetical protein
VWALQREGQLSRVMVVVVPGEKEKLTRQWEHCPGPDGRRPGTWSRYCDGF